MYSSNAFVESRAMYEFAPVSTHFSQATAIIRSLEPELIDVTVGQPTLEALIRCMTGVGHQGGMFLLHQCHNECIAAVKDLNGKTSYETRVKIYDAIHQAERVVMHRLRLFCQQS